MYWAQRTGVRLAACLMVVVFLLGATAVHGQMAKRLGLDELVGKSDNIFVATCTEKTVVYKNGGMVTKYKLKVSENLKGDAKVDKDGIMEMEELGGVSPKPYFPVTSYVQGMANIAPQEEVLLFTANPTFNPKLQALNKKTAISTASPRIVGRSQGRFTVVRHPETGERLVSSVAMEPLPGSLHTPLFVQSEKALRDAEATSGTARVDVATRRKLGAKFNTLAAEARTKAQSAGADTKDANQIVQFESLAGVKSRISGIMGKKTAKQ